MLARKGRLIRSPRGRMLSYAMDWTICIAKAVTIV